jgi:small-conductance mechanosensitive channel
LDFWSTEWLRDAGQSAYGWAERTMADSAALQQAVFLLAALMGLRLLGPLLSRALDARARRIPPGLISQTAWAFARVAPWIVFLVALWIGRLAFEQFGLSTRLIRLAETLTLAWVVIRASALLLRDSGLTTTIAVIAWVLAALNILGLLGPLVTLLDSMAIDVGHFHLSILIVLKAVVLLVVLIWAANAISRLLERRLRAFQRMAPAMQVLVLKLSKIALLTFAVAAALNSVGIDLTGFAVFSGAIGVGVGFGLQKVVSNLVSGVILLLDQSIKPGDVIQIDHTYGWITKLNARFVSVTTRDGTEYLIPNEDLITQRVTNWSYSDDLVRLHVPFGIGYSCDVPLAMQLAIDSAKSVDRVLELPEPNCLLTGFGDNTINLELRFWIRDPRNGTANVRSKVLLGIWERFRDNRIEMPYPQRELTLKNTQEVAELVSDLMSKKEATSTATLKMPGQKPRAVD